MTDERIKQAFEDMGPSTDAEARMLANILAASERETSAAPAASSSPEPKSTKKRSAWTIALPVAASVLLVAGIGIFAITSLSPPEEQTSTRVLSESSSDDLSPQLDEEVIPDGSEAEAPAPGSAIEENLSVEDSAAENTSAWRYPTVELDSIGRLYLVDSQTGGRIADADKVGKKLGVGKALSEDGAYSLTCTVYEYSGTDMPSYAIQYEGENTFYRAASFAR